MRYYVNKDELQYFVYDGVASADFNIIITKTNQLSSVERNVEVVEIDGRNNPLIIDKGNYKPFELEIECCIDAENNNIHEVSSNIKKWLQTDFKFKKLTFSDNLDYYYEAICINKLDIEEVINLLGEFKLTFLCKPLKKQYNSDSYIVLKNATALYNEGLPSNPYIKVIGNGDTTISINNQKLILKNIKEYIEVDSELYNCFKGTENQNNKMYSDFPILEEGKNNISWSGSVTQLEIIPRWVVL